jgi:hypothetical protein
MAQSLSRTVSSKWIKALDARYRGFFWQRGYGAFSSMSPSQLKAVLEYVQAQREHHRTRSFQEEYRKFQGRDHPPSPSYGGTSRSRLQRSPEIDFDKRYVWG